MVQIAWRTGVNMREFAYYGTEAVKFTNAGLQKRQLDQLQPLQVKLVRFYASFAQLTPSQCIQRVKTALDLLHQADMQGIVCLCDALSSPFVTRGDDDYHRGPGGQIVKAYWYEKAYTRNFLPFATSMADALKDHPALFMFELGNEYAIHPQPASGEDGQAFLEFAQAASEALKNAAPHTLVSTGLVNSNHVAPAGQQKAFGTRLYGLASLDAVSIHYYADDGEKGYVPTEVSVAEAVGKPYYIGEFGAPEHWQDRAGWYRDQLQEWFNNGAFTAMPWAFDSSPSDVGVSDTKSFSPIRPQYNEIRNVVQSFGRPAIAVIVPDWKAAVPGLLKSPSVEDNTKRVASIASPTLEWPPEVIKVFVITDGPVSVRTQPRRVPETLIKGLLLNTGQRIEMDGMSRIETDGYVWWRHKDGWSAEKSLTTSEVNMVEEVSTPQPMQPIIDASIPTSSTATGTMPAMTPPPKLDAPDLTTTKTLRVIDGPVVVRDAPTREPRALIKGKSFRTGQRIEVDANSRTEAEDYVWWRHKDGWSAERSLSDPAQVFMIEDTGSTAVTGNVMFERLPLDLSVMQWFYYYGNTEFAFKFGTSKSYDAYSQGLHGGLDFGHPGGAPIVAGLSASAQGKCTYVGNQRKFPPNRVDIQVGPYLLIYGHVANPNFNLQGQLVGPDTPIGVIDGEMRHMHLEIRLGGKIVNPLPFFPKPLEDAVLAKFPPRGEFGFHSFGGKWEAPFDQPDIDVGGVVKGPRGK
ncbi:MAG: cellulase family glycosylhydrolase [Anaerolineae bacterium]|nr:cellulase family glycosylhydrolase [Anaerolineae bacterium]